MMESFKVRSESYAVSTLPTHNDLIFTEEFTLEKVGLSESLVHASTISSNMMYTNFSNATIDTEVHCRNFIRHWVGNTNSTVFDRNKRM